jgi:hypothetical protein
VKNKIKAVTASVLTTLVFLVFGYNELGVDGLKKAMMYAVIISLPIMYVSWKCKTYLLKAPKYMVAVSMIAGTVLFNLLYKYNKIALLCLAILLGILFIFVSIIYTDNELNQN